MTETDIPLLGPGRDLTQAASQTVMTIGSALRERRFALGRHGWSEERAAERVVQGHRRAADPPVREMNEAEFDVFHREGRAGRPGYETRRTGGSHGDVHVTVGPMPEGRGWGLVADAVSPHDTTTGQPAAPERTQARVVAKTETDAKELADELLTGGYPRVQRLHEFGQYATRRAAHAHTEVRETRDHLHQRTADAIRQVWRADPELAERMIRGDQQGTEHPGLNDALPALARELEKLEDRGYAMTDVLSRIDRHDSLRRANNPAALASYFVKALAPGLQVINLDDTEPERSQSAKPTSPRESAQPQAERTRRPGPPAEAVDAAEDALKAALHAAELSAESVRHAGGYPRLRTLLAEQHAQGRDLAPLLSRLPTGRIAEANDPAAYLRAVVESRLSANPLRKTRPDLHSAAELVDRCLPREASRAVIDCDSWPGLANRIGQWRAEGLPVTTMLEALPADWIRTAQDPAQVASALLNSKAATHRKQHTPDTRKDRHTVDPDGLGGPEPNPAAHPRPSTATHAEPEAATTVLDAAPSRSAIPLPPAAVDQLDPDSAVDRVALWAARGTGHPAQDAAIERLLGTSNRVTGDPAIVAAASAHADSERAQADAADRDAAHAAATPDDPATAEREDLTGHEDAHVATQDADQARAIADSDSDLAAAARAELSYRAPAANTADLARPATSRTHAAQPAVHRAPARPVTSTLRPVRTPRPRR